MKSRLIFYLHLIPIFFAGIALFLSGCTPDQLYKEGKYAEAYTAYVERGGKNEIIMKTGKSNLGPGFDHKYRHGAGIKAVSDYFNAAKSLEKINRSDLAKVYYQKTIDTGKYLGNLDAMCRLEKIKEEFGKLVEGIRLRDDQTNYLDQQLRFGRDRRKSFEDLINSPSNDLIPEIEKIRAEYKKVGSSLDVYLSQLEKHILMSQRKATSWSGSIFGTNKSFLNQAKDFSNFLSGIKPPDSISGLSEPERKIVTEAREKLFGVVPVPATASSEVKIESLKQGDY